MSASPRRAQAIRAALAFAHLFCILAAYYALRPVRDEMGVRTGAGRLPWLFTATFAATLLSTPAFGALAARAPRRWLAPAVDLFFASNLVLFFFAFRQPSATAAMAPAFFVWLTVFSLSAVSVSWSLAGDFFDRSEAPRVFGRIAAGGSAGALAGPAAAALLAPRIGTEALLLVAAGLLVLAAFASGALASRPGQARPPEARLGGGALDGVGQTARSGFLRTVAVAVFCTTAVSTLLYVFQADLVGAAIPDSKLRTALFARLDLAVNGLALALQVFVTAAAVRRLGAAGALALVAALVTGGVAGLALAPGLTALLALQVFHRAAHFAFWRPTREMLFVALPPEVRYKAKNFIDTVVFRGGDAASAWALGAVRSAGGGLSTAAWLTVPVGIVWAAASLRMGRSWDRESRPTRGPVGPSRGGRQGPPEQDWRSEPPPRSASENPRNLFPAAS